MNQKGFAAVFLVLMGIQAVGVLVCAPLPLWLHRVQTFWSLERVDLQVVDQHAAPEVMHASPRRPHTPEDFTWVNGMEHFRGKPLLVLAIPKNLEAVENERFVRIHSREFRFEGQMYDIVRTQPGSDTTWYTVYADNKEDKLLAQREALRTSWAEATAANPAPAGPVHPSSEQRRQLLSRLVGPALLPAVLWAVEPPFYKVEGLPVPGQLRCGVTRLDLPPPRTRLV